MSNLVKLPANKILGFFILLLGISPMACKKAADTAELEKFIANQTELPFLDITVRMAVDPFDDDSVIFNTLLHRESEYGHTYDYLKNNRLSLEELTTNDSIIYALIDKIYLSKNIFKLNLYSADTFQVMDSVGDGRHYYEEIRHEIRLNPEYKEDIIMQYDEAQGEDPTMIRLQDPDMEILRMRTGKVGKIEILEMKELPQAGGEIAYEVHYREKMESSKFAAAFGIVLDQQEEKTIKVKLENGSYSLLP